MNAVYKKFAELLEKNNITAYQVSKQTGVSTSTLSEWKNGNYIPKLDKMQKIANFFGVTVDYFLEDLEERKE